VNEFDNQFGYIHAVVGKWKEFLSVYYETRLLNNKVIVMADGQYLNLI